MSDDDVDVSGEAGLGFRVATMGGAFAAAWAGRKLVTTAWQAVTGKEPPVNPEDPDVTWQEAVGWALASGAVIGLARLLASRQVTAAYRKRTGTVPSNLQEASS